MRSGKLVHGPIRLRSPKVHEYDIHAAGKETLDEVLLNGVGIWIHTQKLLADYFS